MTTPAAARSMCMVDPAKVELNVVPISRDTLQERVYRQICNLILDGGIAPGQLVTVQSLADAFGVSAMPVREALKRLTSANALTVVSGRSVGIPWLNRERLADLRDVRLEVEGRAAAWAAGRVGSAELVLLEAELHRMDNAVSSGDPKAYLRGNRSFHFLVYRASGSPTLLTIIEALWLQISPYFNLLHGSGNFRSSNVRHWQLFRALSHQDAQSAEDAIRADITDAFTVLFTELA